MLTACQSDAEPQNDQPQNTNPKAERAESVVEKMAREERPEFGAILDSAGVSGSVLLYDSSRKTVFSNDFKRCAQGYLPASTFKIVNSMVGLETGVLRNKHHVFTWDSLPRRMQPWERDLRLVEAYRVSCVPCYQELARTIGVEKMNHWLDTLGFPGMDVNNQSIDKFWLEGKSRITSFEWLEFARRLAQDELPLSEKTRTEMRSIMLLAESNGLSLRGKTGWSIRDGFNIGWFIGMLESENGIACVVVNVEPDEDFDMKNFPMIRQKIAMQALRQLGYTL